jgi:6-phosphogluconolactonase
MTDRNVQRFEGAEALARAAAEAVAEAAVRAVAERGRFTIALAGGSTPRRLYALLASAGAPFRARIPWDRVHVFFGDERHVPPNHPDSNYGLAREALLDHVRPGSVHRMRGDLPDAGEAAAAYEAELERFFGASVAADPPPALDLVLLGLGSDGHTASLFPGSAALEERRRWVAAPWIARLRAHRLTLTLPVLDRARAVLFLVAGADKADALAQVLGGGDGEAPLPAARVRPEGGAPRWYVDRDAARAVSG